VRH
jgi:hypothetical protein